MKFYELEQWCFINDVTLEKKTDYHYRLTGRVNGAILDLYPVNCKYHIVKHDDPELHQSRSSYENALAQVLETVLLSNTTKLNGTEPGDKTIIADEFPLTEKQQLFYDAAMNGENIFLTGEAGTGKTHVVKKVIAALREQRKKIIAVAPTGIAANNIEGVTIHSMFQLTPHGVLSFDECQYLKHTKRDVLRNADVILIDEISMLRPDVLDGMHWTLKKNGLPGLDKKQIIFIGDLEQLPNVLNDNTRSVLYQTYDGDTFAHAKIYPRLNARRIELEEIVRQTDIEFIEALRTVRRGNKSEYFRQFVHTETTGVVLAPHNVTVQRYNGKGLAAQPGELFRFEAKVDGTLKPEDFNLEKVIEVKHGCKVMYLVNSSGDKNPLRNGTLGIFVERAGVYFIRVGGVDYALDKYIAVKKEYVYNKAKDELELQEIGSIEQYPIKLAYALSIHKSQGMTFDEVTIDLSQPCFQKGQMYVALSRVRTPAGLRIITQNNY